MEYVIFFAIGFLSFVVGTFGFAQIIGSLRTKQPNFIIPIAVWISLLFIVYLLISWLAPTTTYALYIGYMISFVVILFQKKIE